MSAARADRRAVVIGLRKTGEAVAAALRAEGWSVTVAEDAPGTPGYAARAATVRALGAEIVESPTDWDTLLAGAELLVPSPGVRPTHPGVAAARAGGIAVRSEIDLAAERITCPIVAVTGTNGKTTVTELIAAMLRADGRTVACGGNIGTPLIESAGTAADLVVAEVSSFQLEFTTDAWRPAIAVVLNVADDHLDWHGSFAAYAAAKARVFAAQRSDDLVVVAAADPAALALVRTAPGRVIEARLDADQADLRLADGSVVVPVADLPRTLPHDRTNSLVAAEAAHAAGASIGAIAATLRNYRPPHHRVEFVGERDGVAWFDDSKATNPHAAVRAIEAFDSIVLLAGGQNKGLDLTALAGPIDRVRAVVAIGQAADEIVAAFGDRRPVVVATSMREAVAAAARLARHGDRVLLSPGCASYDWYSGYDERGDDFAREVRTLLTEPEPEAER